MDALLAILLLKPLLECFWVFSNPVKVPSVDSFFTPRTQRVPFFFLCLPAQGLDALLAEFLFHRTFPSSVSFILCLYALARCPSGRALRILSDSVSSELSAEFLPLCTLPTGRALTESSFCSTLNRVLLLHPVHAQCPPGRAPQNSSEILSATVFLSHSLAS
jgi:hypothetical protein